MILSPMSDNIKIKAGNDNFIDYIRYDLIVFSVLVLASIVHLKKNQINSKSLEYVLKL